MTSAGDAALTHGKRENGGEEERERGERYLNKQGMQEAPGDRGDVGCDDFEVERLKNLTHPDHGVPLPIASDAYDQCLLTHFTNFKLQTTPKYFFFFKKFIF